MRKRKRLIVTILIPALLVLGVLLVAASGRRTNPKIERRVAWDSQNTKHLFYRSCSDCHSHETKWPWYSYVAPASWLVINNVNEGRSEFNISASRLGEADEATEKLSEGEMPPSDYLLLHPEARLTQVEKSTLIAGLRSTFGGEEGASSRGGDDDDDDDDDEEEDDD